MRKKINGVRSNRSGVFKGNWSNRIVKAFTDDKRPTRESIFSIEYISKINGKVQRVKDQVFGYEITFFNLSM